MAVRQKTDVELAGELEAIATAAADRMRALSDGDVERETDLRRLVGEAASRAIAAGLSLASIADAARLGHQARARGARQGAAAKGGARRGTQARGRARVRAGGRTRVSRWP